MEENNIQTIVEEANFNDYIKQNNWDYNYSYKASRYYLEESIKKYSSLEYFIDIHRDAINHDSSTILIGDKAYAKVLFVKGYIKKKSICVKNCGKKVIGVLY